MTNVFFSASSTKGGGNEGGTESSSDSEIVAQEIADSTVEGGSGTPWRGSGKEPQWNNPKSTKAYDDIESNHGPKRKPNDFWKRVASSGNEQGQWFDSQFWVEAEKAAPKHPGRYIIDFKRPVGRVYKTDKTIEENVTRAVVVRKADGTLRSAYLVTNSFTLK